jgi:hypothetical protein
VAGQRRSAVTYLKADADALDYQGSLHYRISQFYRNAAAQMKQHGGNVTDEFQQWKPSYASQYHDNWLHPSVNDLLAEADKHDYWYNFFTNLAKQIRLAEGQLSGNAPSGYGNGHEQ